MRILIKIIHVQQEWMDNMMVAITRHIFVCHIEIYEQSLHNNDTLFVDFGGSKENTIKSI